MQKHLSLKHGVLTLLLMLGSCVGLYAQQEQRVTLNLKNVSLKEMFRAIEEQSTYRFSYRNNVVDDRADITVSKKNVVAQHPAIPVYDEEGGYAGGYVDVLGDRPNLIRLTDNEANNRHTNWRIFGNIIRMVVETASTSPSSGSLSVRGCLTARTVSSVPRRRSMNT